MGKKKPQTQKTNKTREESNKNNKTKRQRGGGAIHQKNKKTKPQTDFMLWSIWGCIPRLQLWKTSLI